MELEKRVNKAERLFSILKYLSSHEYATATELAKLCKTSKRTIYRDMRVLEEIGVTIITEGKRGYKLIKKPYQGETFLTKNEWLALNMIPFVLGGSPTFHRSLMETYLSALGKMKNFSRKYQTEMFGYELSRRILLDEHARAGKMMDIMEKIIQSILSNKTIEVVYYSIYRDEKTKRKLNPYYIVPRRGHLYLIAFCHYRQEVRTFRLSRFIECEFTDETFELPKDFDIEAFLDNRWGIMDEGTMTEFVVKFNKDAAPYVRERDFYAATELNELENGNLILKTTVKSEKEFLHWLRQFGMDAEVLAPERVREQLKKEYEKMMKMYLKK